MVSQQCTPSSPSAPCIREIEECAIAFHDALQSAGDFEGRELLDCVRLRLERAAAELRKGCKRGGAAGAEETGNGKEQREAKEAREGRGE